MRRPGQQSCCWHSGIASDNRDLLARAVVDAFRLRGDVGYELARDALREWLHRGGKPARVIEIASCLPRAKSPVLQALEMLG